MYEDNVPKPTILQEKISGVRKKVCGFVNGTRDVQDRIIHVIETGRAHTASAVSYVKDEEKTLPRVGVVTLVGLAGLMLARKGGLLKKFFYASIGVGAAASSLYPKEARHISEDVYTNAVDFLLIGYNFIVGVKPELKKIAPVDMLQNVTNNNDVKSVTNKKEESFGLKSNIARDYYSDQSNDADKDMYTTR